MKNIITMICLLIILATFQSVLAQKKNVLFIMVDDLNDYIGAMNGHPQTLTPNLNKLAQKSIVFQNAHCSSPICVPSRTALLTGRRPHETGITNNIDGYFRGSTKPSWMQNIVTLPQYFKQKGYETITVGKIFHFSISGGSNRDPISWSIDAGAGVGGGETPINKYQVPNTPLIYSPIKETLTQSKDWKRADYCANYLKKTHNKPFFLACGISRPHLPFYAPQEFFNKFDLNTIKLPPYLIDDLNDLKKHFSLNHLQYVQRANKWKDVVKAYLASVAYADACIGHLLNELEKSAYKNNTIVVLMGDHGFQLGEKNHFQKFTLWEKSLKTPLIIYDPSIRTSGSCNKVVSLQDIYPTLVDLCGLPKPSFTVRGQSLRKLIENPNSEWKGFALASFAQDNLQQPDSHSFRMDRYHYIWYYNGDEELYDLQIDPNEWTNLAYKSSHLTIKNQMKSYMRAMLAGNENPFNSKTLEAPNNLVKKSLSENQVKLTWNPALWASAYQLRYRIQGNQFWKNIDNINDNFLILNDLKLNTTYEWQVRSINEKEAGNYSYLNTFETNSPTIILENEGKDIDFQIIKIYPNPSRQFTKIALYLTKPSHLNIQVSNSLGQMIQQEFVKIKEGLLEYKINTSELSKGIYLVQISSSEGKKITGKFLVE